MAKIAPFRGYRFNPAEAGDLNKAVTQPYDKIDDALKADYLARSDYNVVRIIKGPTKPDDTVNDNQYTRAAEFWREWIDERILLREGGPAIYPYTQEFTVEGKTFVRQGLIALVALDEEQSRVRAHEKTLSGPKADRLRLMRATEANDGQIFMLYDDQVNQINNLVNQEITGASPIMQVTDDYGAIHRLFRIVKPGAVKDIAEAFEDYELFIADGHHRYETAVNYMKECISRNWKPVGAETFSYRMMTLVNMHDAGLVVLPTHRLIHSVPGFNVNEFLMSVSSGFEVSSHPDRAGLYAALDAAAAEGRTAFGFAAQGLDGYRLLTLKNPGIMDSLLGEGHSETWKKLDVTVLHTAILEKSLGIDAGKLAAETNVRYVRGRDEALDNVTGEVQAGFILNATKVEQVRDTALAGEKMPQKSTDFFPKLLTGMVMMKMSIDKSMEIRMWQAPDM